MSSKISLLHSPKKSPKPDRVLQYSHDQAPKFFPRINAHLSYFLDLSKPFSLGEVRWFITTHFSFFHDFYGFCLICFVLVEKIRGSKSWMLSSPTPLFICISYPHFTVKRRRLKRVIAYNILIFSMGFKSRDWFLIFFFSRLPHIGCTFWFSCCEEDFANLET